MEIGQLRCFVAVAEELHFGRAARRLAILPASLGRQIRLLEESLSVRLVERTTRTVLLTRDGTRLLGEARQVLAQVDAITGRFRRQGRRERSEIRIGAIDSAAAGLMPQLLLDLKLEHPAIAVQLLEDKTARLLPKLRSGRLDLAFIRPPEAVDRSLELLALFSETAVVAMPQGHRLAGRERVAIADLDDEPLIVPDRRSRPHSHDLTIELFAAAGSHLRIAQVADEKQTIVVLVAAGIGLAIVPRWTSRLAVGGVRYVPLDTGRDGTATRLPLSAAWLKGVRDPLRDSLVAILTKNLAAYARNA
ncbi:LysR family transcriptional regulator [Labrys wisconsinensis]|uniref:DNA-binding transcriptional LysR family regulator n=1 Tax=Labrys wisconsinensis TaxID=425677 RepID=A0ABU0JLM9_9HYPH|nr:LysR family transcriptional regulator [Labrys wisconsinensis]MDQ0474525.1 DNA-binding transcriptional LysR family regulator [Labrys wisconsinensis]